MASDLTVKFFLKRTKYITELKHGIQSIITLKTVHKFCFAKDIFTTDMSSYYSYYWFAWNYFVCSQAMTVNKGKKWVSRLDNDVVAMTTQLCKLVVKLKNRKIKLYSKLTLAKSEVWIKRYEFSKNVNKSGHHSSRWPYSPLNCMLVKKESWEQ